MSAPIHIEDLRCARCDSDKPMAFTPGSEDERHGLLLIAQGEPVRCLCMDCWATVEAA